MATLVGSNTPGLGLLVQNVWTFHGLKYGSDYDVMLCDGCSYYGTFLTCWSTVLVM